MADSTISGLVAAAALAGSEPVPIDQSGATVRTTVAAIGALGAPTSTASVPGLDAALALKAPLASPALTGTPTVPTAAALTNTTQIASTAFVTAAVAAGGGGGIPGTRLLTAGAGLAGGGDLSADRTFDVGAGTGITVNANDVALTAPVTAVLGGTGQTSYAVGDILYASTTTALAKLADIATGNALISGGTNTAPAWGKVGLTTHVSGILPIANGGTGTTTGTSADTTTLLAGKANTTHTHAIADTTGLQTALDGKADDADLTAKANVDDPSFTGTLIHAGIVTAASLSTSQNDYNPDVGDLKAIWELSSSAAVNITGIGNATTGRMIYITNTNAPGGFAITLKNQDAGSSAVNQFAFPNDVVLYPRDGITLIRTASRWRMFSPYVSRIQTLVVACSDETTALVSGAAKTTFRMPHAMTLTGVRASLTTAQVSGASLVTVDINKNGTSVLGTKITIDNTEKTSVTAAAQPTITTAALADDDEITVDIDAIDGASVAKGLKITLIGVPASPLMALLRDRIEDRLETEKDNELPGQRV